MIESESSVTKSSVEQLRTAAELAHEKYSEAFERHAEAEIALGVSAANRSRLVRDLEATHAALRDARRTATDAAIAGDGFADAAARVAAIQNEVSVLNLAVRHFHSHPFQDAEGASLVAKLGMLEQQHSSEAARLDLHIATIYQSLGAAALADGGIKVEMGAATNGLKKLLLEIRREGDIVREALASHALETRALQDEFEKGEQA
jgi:multidrug efflux pump subunit AcrA (membrane-fusion protein)